MKKKPIVIAGVYDALSALLAQKAGFKALYLSGGALSVSLLGRPDVGLLTLDEVLHTAKHILRVVSLPLYVDVDTGFGGDVNVERTVMELESIGVKGIQMEDQVFPKRCGHLAGKEVVPVSQMVEKIKKARAARKSKAFQLIARTDARGVLGLEEALWRADNYKKAGADIIFPEALQSKDEFQQFGSKKTLGPLIANMTEFGISPALSAGELASLGYSYVLFPMTAFRAAAFAMEKVLSDLHKKGHSRSVKKQLQKRTELYKLIRYDNRTKNSWTA